MTVSLLNRLSDNYPLREEDGYFEATQPLDALVGDLKMLLMSRSRWTGISDFELINISVLNYGVDGVSDQPNEMSSLRRKLEACLRNAIVRFEPRLSQLSISSEMNSPQIICFTLCGMYLKMPVRLELVWNECTGRFSIDK